MVLGASALEDQAVSALAEAELDSAQPSIDRFRSRGETVLVVYDVETQRTVAQVMPEKLGYKATAVASGEAALRYLEINRVDLVLLDMIMSPGIGGLETYKCILAGRPNQKAVIAGGYTETDQVREAQRLGAGRYLSTVKRLSPAAQDFFGPLVSLVQGRFHLPAVA